MRRGLTLLELIIVMAILGLMIAMLLPAIHKVRMAALRTQSCNNLRQMGLAFHLLAGENDGKIDKLPEQRRMQFGRGSSSMFQKILPQLGINQDMTPNSTKEEMHEMTYPVVPAFLSPADPTINIDLHVFKDPNPRLMDRISYVANMTALEKTLLFPIQIQDGTTSTILFSEKYWINSMSYDGREPKTWMSWKMSDSAFDAANNAYSVSGRRATFADKGSWDDTPVPDGEGYSKRQINYPATFGMPPNGKAFDLMPLYTNTWCNRLQTPHPAGLPVALFDGSVRTLNPNIEERIFWSLVTPGGGEVVGDF